MIKPQIILVGAGGHARSCIDVIEQNGEFSIFGLVGTHEEVGDEVLGYQVLGTDNDLGKLKKTCEHALITVGQIKTPKLRKKLFLMLMDLGYSLPTVVSPRSYVSRNASIGKGTIIMHGAVINAGARVGQNCIINSMSLIEHDAIVSDHCHISTGAILNGDGCVGEGSFIGSGSVIREGINLGQQCIVGMGVVVRQSQPDNSLILKVH
ncbi:MAG: acetyltransferase [Candidatus Berkelbacteria bacterium]|nr:acetyltransferase [Candidatus Berkelbacteria bacterium]